MKVQADRLKKGDRIKVTLRGHVSGVSDRAPIFVDVVWDGANSSGNNRMAARVLNIGGVELTQRDPAAGDLLTPGKGERPTHKIVGLFKNYWIVSQLNLEGEEMYEPVLYSPENFSDMERTPAP